MNLSKYLIVITGPTGIGKTDLSIRINETFQTSIVSADSRQVYQEMFIGTAKPTAKEISEGNIKLVDHISVTEDYNVGLYEQEAIDVIAKDHHRNQFSIICGGTGLYIKIVCEGIDTYPDVPKDVIVNIEAELDNEGIESLQKRLKALDPVHYEKMDINNKHRLIRALSIIDHTGEAFSSYQSKRITERPFKIINIVLDDDRTEIYKRIEDRVDRMISNGLINEVESLLKFRTYNALNTVGYSEVFRYFDGDITKEFCISEIKKNTRRYAKRQLTWLRKYNPGKRFSANDYTGIMDYIQQSIDR
jgi:tRNA dimethylallyltransferase